MPKKQRADEAKKHFVVRQDSFFGGFSSLLGISSVYQRHFGWHLRFDSYFIVRALAVLVFWMVPAVVMDVVTCLASSCEQGQENT